MNNGIRSPEPLATRILHAFSVVGVFVVGIAISMWLARWLSDANLLYLFLLPAYVAVVLTHELGHAIAGLVSDFRVPFLYMGPLRVEWPRGRPVRLELNHRLSLWGGAVVVLPRAYPRGDDLGPFRRRMIVMFAAGPGASILAGLIALRISMAMPSGGDSFGSGLSWLQLLALMSLFVGIGQLVPIKIGDQRSDGLRVLRLLSRRPGTNNALQDVMVVANADGIRPRDWPLPAYSTFGEIRDLPTLVLIYYALLDRGLAIQAWKVLNLPSDHRRGRSERTWRVVRDLERTYMRTIYLNEDGSDLPAADIPTKQPRVSALSLVRARAARMVASGDLEEALRCADSVRPWRSVPYTSGLTQFNLAEIDNVLARANQ
ncbi:MAG: M50 family metallopeptidase [Gemmatimonadetes bacterium]|nr:M50 family metallopeptidase [Gemmatimonadota bacterium]